MGYLGGDLGFTSECSGGQLGGGGGGGGGEKTTR